MAPNYSQHWTYLQIIPGIGLRTIKQTPERRNKPTWRRLEITLSIVANMR